MDVMQSSRAQQSLDEGLDRTIEILSQHLTPTIPHNVIEYGSFINNTTYINRLNQESNHNIANSPLPNNLLVNSISNLNSQLANDNNPSIIQENNLNSTVNKKEAEEMKSIIDTLDIFNQAWPKPLSPLKPIDPNDKNSLIKNEPISEKNKIKTEKIETPDKNTDTSKKVSSPIPFNTVKTEKVNEIEEQGIYVKEEVKSNVDNDIFEDASSSLSSVPSYSLTSNSDSGSSIEYHSKDNNIVNNEIQNESKLKSIKSELDEGIKSSKKKYLPNKTSTENIRIRKRTKTTSENESDSDESNNKYNEIRKALFKKAKAKSVAKQDSVAIKIENEENEVQNKPDTKTISISSYRKKYSNENNELENEITENIDSSIFKRRKKIDKSIDDLQEYSSKDKKLKAEKGNSSDNEHSLSTKEIEKIKIKNESGIGRSSSSNSLRKLKSQKAEVNNNIVAKKQINSNKKSSYSEVEEEPKEIKRKTSINAYLKRQKLDSLFSDSEDELEEIPESKKSISKPSNKKISTTGDKEDDSFQTKKLLLKLPRKKKIFIVMRKKYYNRKRRIIILVRNQISKVMKRSLRYL